MYTKKRYFTLVIGVLLVLSIFSAGFLPSTSTTGRRSDGSELDDLSSERKEAPAPPGTPSVEHHGDRVIGVFDNFSDGDHTSDPQWTVSEGNWTVKQETLEGQGRISTDEFAHRAYGRWEYDFSLARTGYDEDYQMIRFYFIQMGHPDPAQASGYFATVTGEGSFRWDAQINLWRVDEGETEQISSVNWEPDADQHTLAIERDENNVFSLYLDGDGVGSAEDGTYTSSEYKGFLMQGDKPGDKHDIYEIRVTEGNEDNLITWDASPDDPEDVVEYEIYRSEDENGAYESIGNVTADGSPSYEYIDEGKGELDDTYWWYEVRSVGEGGESGTDPVREPGPPLINVTTPEGGEVWEVGTQENITWTTEEGDEPIDSVDLWYSTDAGSNWNTIATGLEDEGNYLWTVPNEHSTECLIRARVSDDLGRFTEGTSEDLFSIEGMPPDPPKNLEVDHYEEVVEELHMTSNTHRVNGLEAYELGTEQSDEVTSNDIYKEEWGADGGTINWGIRVWRLTGNGEEIEITEDVPTAVVTRGEEDDGKGGIQKAQWDVPGTKLDPEDAVVIRVYAEIEEETDWELQGEFATEQLGTQRLKAANWTINYYTYYETGTLPQSYTLGTFSWGDVTYNSRIDGVTYSGRKEGGDHNFITWNSSADDPGGVSHYNIYRSEERNGPWDEPIDSVEADGSASYSYLDEGRGIADDIYWWYVVRAVEKNGLEENNTDQGQEPFIVDHIDVSPPKSSIPKGETQQYTATAYDEADNEIREVTDQVDWSIEDGAGGSWEGNVYTSENPGEWNVTAEYDGVSEDAKLIVEVGEVDTVKITPGEDQTVEAGETVDFSAEAYDKDDNLIEDDDTELTWENADGSGLFNETDTGGYDVSATYNDVTSPVVTVTVEPSDVAQVTIEPDEDKVIVTGDTIDFSAEAYDEYSNLIEDEDTGFTWENADETGLFDETEAGEYEVSATYNDVSSSVVNVTVELAGADHLEIQPREETVSAGESVAYTSVAYDESDNEIGDVTEETSWSIEEEAGGHWENNSYTAESAGEWTVTGKYEGIEGDATLNVDPADLDSIEIEPEEKGIPAGKTITYSASTCDEFGNMIEDVTDDTEWSIEEGAGGEWTGNEYESENPGEWNVTGTYVMDGENLTAEASLTVLSEEDVWVDITAPDEWAVVPPDVTVEWTSANAEYHEVRLNEDDWVDVSMNTSHTFEGLEKGDHIVEVRAVRGDESVIENVSFTVDPDILYLEIVSPREDEKLSTSNVTVEWTSGNAEYHEVRLNEDDWIDVGMNTSYTFEYLKESDHIVDVRAVKGEESVTETVSFAVEIGALDVNIISPDEGDVFGEEEVTVEWEVSGEAQPPDAYEIRLGSTAWKNVEAGTEYTFEDLEDKEHEVEVRVADADENSDTDSVSDSVSFIVDTMPPEIDIVSPEEDESVDEDSITVEWNCSGGPSGLDRVEIRLDEEEWKSVGEKEEYNFTDLSEGEHRVEINATDNAGNEGNETVSFEVSEEGGTGFQLSSWSCLLPLILLIIVVLMLMAVFFRRGGEEEGDGRPSLKKRGTDSSPEEEDEEEISDESEWKEEDEEITTEEETIEEMSQEGEEPEGYEEITKEEEAIEEELEPELEEDEETPEEFPVPEEFKEPPVPEDVAKEDALDELAQLRGVGSSKAENLYENGVESLEDLRETSKEELQEIKGIGPALSEKILDSLEDLEE